MFWPVLAVSLACLLLNVPLGAMRARSRRYSWQWMVWIHASIPLIVALRIGLGLSWTAIPVNIAAAVLGQLIGSWPARRRQRTDSPA